MRLVGEESQCVFVEVFFFQAEDGIRDSPVTGVQTCALPILAQLFPISLEIIASEGSPA